MTEVRRLRSEELTPRALASLRSLFDEAWPDADDAFDEDDWEHTIGGVHLVAEDEDGEVLAHASVVERTLTTGGRDVHTGYVEGVATRTAHRRRGLGSAVMRAVNDHIDATFELGALGTGEPGFYERLGWRLWRGPTGVRGEDGSITPTPEDDGAVMVRLTPASPELDLDAQIACDPRAGDVW